MEPDVESTRLSLGPRVAVRPQPEPAVDLEDTLPVGTTTRRRLLSDDPEPGVIRPVPAAGATTARPAARDSLVLIRIGERVIALDRPVLVGRAPRRPRIPGDVEPLLVGVVSPSREVSSTHLELRQSGSTVVVRDLRATNGSLVIARGHRPRTLAQGESMVVGAGTAIDLGDGVVIEILGAPSAPADEYGEYGQHGEQGETA